jgi:ABC-type multidrug transport system ATPase subunit
VQLAVERALLEEAVAIGRGITDPEVSLKVAHQPFPNHEMVDFQRKLEDSNGVIFVLMGTLFSFYIQCSNLVVEKEKKLKLQLKMMGTRDTPMWLAWWLIFVFEAFVLAMIWVGTGAMVQFSIFLNTDFAVMFCFFFTLGLALAGFASFLSTFLRSTTSALGMSLFLFMVNWLIGGALTRILYTNLIPRSARNALSLLPSILYNKAYGDLNDAVGGKGKGMRWEHLSDNDYDCPSYCALFCLCDYTPVDDDPINGEPFYIFPIGECMEWFVFDWLLYAILAVYLDNVVPNAYGRRQPLWYLCLPSYWGFKRPANIDTSTPVSDEGHAYDDDVLREQDRVLAATDSGDAIRIVNLCKRFKKFTAVHKINFGVQNDSLFCLLGHNGAGKTTTFNMLSGMFPPTYGDAFIFGKSVRHELRQVQGMMGICPQHDVLWEELSAREHLELFAGLSLVESSEVPKKIAYFLEAVDLLEAANIPCGKYSGGMKRRLSVACSLIADPRVVYLDEPTTGMDPVNRRGVWDVIEKAKKNRVVVLTTHAMEEADTLGDVISIMSRGRLHCLGTSLHLKNKFGSGYQLDVTCPVSTHAQVSDFLASKIVGHRRVSETQFSAMVPLNKVSELEALYAAVEGGEGERLKMELAVSMCTLESVFIKIAHQAQDPEALRQLSMSELPVADTATPGTVMVEIECPVGSKAGDPVQIMHEGQSFDLTVPAGINQGMKFQVQLPSSNGNGVPRSNSHERRAASSIGADPFPDVDGLLVDHIPFKGASFGTQFKALSLKNLTYQKRQCCTNVTFCILTVLWMFILFIFKFIPVWIGFDQNLACGINMTKANAVQLSIPNLDVLGEVVSTIDAVATLQSCVPDTDKNATDIEKMQGWAYAAMCGTTAVSRPNDRQRGQMRATFDVFGCDASFFDELVEKFSYYRSAGENGNVELFCSAEARPDITVTNYRGIPEVKQGVDCQQASFHFFATCSFPTICPSNSTETDDRTEISPYQATLDSFQTYGCSVDVSDRIFPFLGKQPRTYAAEACVSDYICDPTHECTAECPPPSAPPAAPPAAPVAGRRLLEALADSDFDGEETLALLRQYATHAPRDAAATSNAPETWHMGPTGSWMHLPTVQQAKHAAALQEGGGALTQAAAFLGALFGPVPAAPSRSSAASPRITRTRSAVPGLAAQEQQSRRLTESIATPEKSCTEKAMDFCRATTIISECPNTLNLMKAKTVSAARPHPTA